MHTWLPVILVVLAGFGLNLLLTSRPRYDRQIDRPREQQRAALAHRPYRPGLVGK